MLLIFFVKESLKVLQKHYTMLIHGKEDDLPPEASCLPKPDASLFRIGVGEDIIRREL